ncbi:MAG: hypothetical protein H0V93_13880 [Euzebyales bacterium]|nr:hypothetical protein [Euzebyales bacterium]
MKRKEQFVSDPDRHRFPGMKVFAGVGVEGCVSRADSNDAVDPYLRGAEALNAAAFYALVEEDREVARIVAAEIVAQVNYQDTRFGDRSRFCVGSGPSGDEGPIFGVADWLTSIVYARDYLSIYDDSLFSGAQAAEFNAWAKGFATWVNARNDAKLDQMFEDRPGGDYTPNSVGNGISDFARNGLWDDGPVPHTTAARYNNRNARAMRTVGIIGVLTGDQSLVNSAKKFWKEVIMFAYFPEGGLSDFLRWEADDAGKGWKYASEILSPMVMTADAIARSSGDTELFDLATTKGLNGTQGEHNRGGPKTLERAVEDTYRYVTGEYDYTAGGTRIRAGDRLHDVALAPANRYYQSEYIRDRYMRKSSVRAEPYPTEPLEGKFNVEGGDCGTLPGVLFMFGQMEHIWPYSG